MGCSHSTGAPASRQHPTTIHAKNPPTTIHAKNPRSGRDRRPGVGPMPAPQTAEPIPAAVEVRPRREHGDVELRILLSPDDTLDVALRLVGTVRTLRRSP